MGWFWYALIASALWGLGYVGSQYLLRFFSATEVIFFESAFVVVVLLPWLVFHGAVGQIVTKLSNVRLLITTIACCCIYLLAVTFIYKSIVASNATLAALVESAYPIFTMIFAYVLLGQVQFNIYTIIGTGLIISGLTLINIFGHVA